MSSVLCTLHYCPWVPNHTYVIVLPSIPKLELTSLTNMIRNCKLDDTIPEPIQQPDVSVKLESTP
jgi:hypothetical protein